MKKKRNSHITLQSCLPALCFDSTTLIEIAVCSWMSRVLEKVLTRYGVMNEYVLHHLILIAYKFGMIFFGGVKFCSRVFFFSDFV